MTTNEKAQLAIQRLLIELEYCDEKLGSDRAFTRNYTIGYARSVLQKMQKGDTA